MFNQSAMDPSCSPEGTQLHVMGGIFPGAKGRDRAWLRQHDGAVRADVETMWPGFAKSVWRRRHLVFEPSFGVIQMPGLVGQVPAALAGARTSRVCGSPARRSAAAASAPTVRRGPPSPCVEEYLGRRLLDVRLTGGATDGRLRTGRARADHAAGRGCGEVREAQRGRGFDAVWWPDHLMGWHPDTMWTPDLTPLADVPAQPARLLRPAVMMGVVGAATERIKVGVVVTDLIRRNPAMAAATALTLDHVTKGRAIIGLGSGEKLNVDAVRDVVRQARRAALRGHRRDAPALGGRRPGRLRGTASTRLDRARSRACALRRHAPEIWTAAHGPRMLR